MKAADFYRQGRLEQAVGAATEEVRNKPTDVGARSFLAELLCITGKLDRADVQLEAIGTQLPKESQVGVALQRQLVRAAQWREQLFSAGRLPAMLGSASPEIELRLRATIELRAGDPAAAAKCLEQAETLRTHPRGRRGGDPFDDWRDLDDLFGGVLELLTSNGKYYWVPLERVRSLQLEPPKHPIDLLWPCAEISIEGGPEGKVYLPAIYPSTTPEPSESERLGRSTDWTELPGGLVRGSGQRTFLVGQDACALQELGHIEVEQAGTHSAGGTS